MTHEKLLAVLDEEIKRCWLISTAPIYLSHVAYVALKALREVAVRHAPASAFGVNSEQCIDCELDECPDYRSVLAAVEAIR